MRILTPEERTKAIADRAQAVGRTDRKWVKGAHQLFDVLRVPVDYLILNADNRRFRAEKLGWEEELGRPLDPQSSEKDERSLVSILLDDAHRIADDEVVGKPSKDAQALMDDWAARGQEQPLWIRPDGCVVNGNRRLSALKRLAQQRGSATGLYDYVEVIVLPYEDIDDNQMFQMEAREQLTEGYKVRYSDINLLLTLREAAERHEIDWTDDVSISATAKKIQDLVGNDARYAETQLWAIRYMDEYLDYTGESGRYQRLVGQVERFRDIGKNMKAAQREAPEQAFDLLILQFNAVRAGVGHMDMRELRKLTFEDPNKFEGLSKEVDEIVTREVDEPTLAPVQPVVLQDDLFGDTESDDAAVDPPPPPSPAFPVTSVKRAFDVAIEGRKSRQRDDAELALRAAADRLEQVNPEQVRTLLEGPSQDKIRDAIATIRTWINAVDDAGV